MNLVNSITKIPTFMMKIASSIFSSGSNFICGASGFTNFIDVVFNLLSKLFYFVSKWMLFILDILFSFIRQLCGLEMKYDSLETMVSKESDFVFNLLFTATDTITPIIRNLIGLVISLILFFAILAVIKTTFESLKNKSPADVKGVFAKMIRAFVLLIITPMLAIIGIVAANSILKALYNATNTTNSNSLSTQLFSASATSASAYRIYALNGLKIPITFDFTKQMEVIEYYKDHPLTDEYRNYVGSLDDIVFTNYKEFNEGSFTEFARLNDTYSPTGSAAERAAAYYTYYDRHADAFSVGSEKTTVNSYKKILAYRPEYYVMADVVDYCIESGEKAYFRTVQEMLDSIAEIEDNILFNTVVSMFDITFHDKDLKEYKLNGTRNPADQTTCESDNDTWLEVFKKDAWRVIRFESTYYDVDDSSKPTRKMDIQYNHVRGATDELEGAKYIMCVGKDATVWVDGEYVKKSYYYPLTIGYTAGSGFFESEFIQMNQMVAAKGIFSQSTYPTAIRQTEDGAEVQFYRHNLITVTVGNPESIATGEMKSEEKSGLAKFFEKLAALFNPKINLSLDKDQIVTAYSYEEIIVNNLASGTLSLSYMFEDSFTSFLGGTGLLNGAGNVVRSATGAEGTEQIGLFGLKLENLFLPRKINLIILIMGSLIMVKMLFLAVFALINRGYELFLTILIYPTACATIPLDESGYQQWTRTYVGRLFATYGYVLGLNFIIMLLPVISELQVFTAGEIAISKPIARFRNLFSFGGVIPITYDFLADFLNLVCVILFEIVAFTLLETLPETISQIVGASNVRGINPIETFAKAYKLVSSVITTIASEGSGILKGLWDVFLAISPNKKKRDDARARLKQKTKDKAKKFVPGSAIVDAAKDKKNLKEKKNAQKDAMANLKESMNGGKTIKDEKTGQERAMTQEEQAKDVEESFNKMIEAQSQYNAALKDPRGNREAEDEKKREAEKEGLDESSRGDDEDMEYDDEGNETGEAADVSHKSSRQLKKSKKRQESIVRRLEAKEKDGSLTSEEKRSLERQKKKLEKTNEALNGKKTYKNAKKKMKKLQKKQGGGALTDGEQNELNMYTAEVQNYESGHSKADRKKIAGQRKAEAKERMRSRKLDEKEAERQKKVRQRFTTGSKLSQGVHMLANTAEQERMLKGLEESGLSREDIESGNVNEDALTFKQKQQLKRYRAATSNIQTAVDAVASNADVKAKYDARRQAQYDLYKHRNKAGSLLGGGDRLLKKKNANVAKHQQELSNIELELDNIKNSGGVDASNIKRYQELQRRKAKLVAEQNFARSWETQNSKSRKQLKEEAKDYRYQNKLAGYNFDMRVHQQQQDELRNEVIKDLKKKLKRNPKTEEIERELKRRKEEMKNGGKSKNNSSNGEKK